MKTGVHLHRQRQLKRGFGGLMSLCMHDYPSVHFYTEALSHGLLIKCKITLKERRRKIKRIHNQCTDSFN